MVEDKVCEIVAVAGVLPKDLERWVLGNGLESPCGGWTDAVDGHVVEVGPLWIAVWVLFTLAVVYDLGESFDGPLRGEDQAADGGFGANLLGAQDRLDDGDAIGVEAMLEHRHKTGLKGPSVAGLGQDVVVAVAGR